MVIGPFPKTDVNTTTLPSLNPSETHKGVDDKTIRWREAAAQPNGMLNFRSKIGMNARGIGYAFTYVYAPKAVDTVLLLGSDETVKVWLNGTEIHQNRIYRRITPDADAIPCHLKAGWNQILCSVEQNGWTWGLYVRFTDADDVLKYNLHPEK